MTELFSFDLPRPLSPQAERVLREKLMMRRQHNVPLFDGIAFFSHDVQVVLLPQDEETYRLVARAERFIPQEKMVFYRAKLAHIAQQAGSQDESIKSAMQRQTPREEGEIHYPGHAHKKRGILDILHLRRD